MRRREGLQREVHLDVRYVGQEHTLTIAAPSAGGRLATDAASLSALFEREYARTFGHSMDEHHEVVTVRALVRLPREIRHAPRTNGARPARRERVEAWSFARDEAALFALVGARHTPPRRHAGGPRHPDRDDGDHLSRRGLRRRGALERRAPRAEAARMSAPSAAAVDPIATEIVRQGLNAAAEQMKRALVRTAFSPVIYEVLDFAAALYDRDVAMLAQAPSLPTFMGTMSFCVRSAVDAVGGEGALEPGDIVLYNVPYGTGSHPQDVAMVMPVFAAGELVGYAAIKAHWLDIGGKDPYSTDTVDVFQEGTIFPGVKLYSGGRLVEDIYRFAIANSRVPKMVAGDINATVVGVRTGAAALTRLVERHGLERFRESAARIYAHGEAVVRRWFEQLPDGRYVGRGEMDSNGVDDAPVPFEVVVEIDGSQVRLDYTGAPPQQAGPINCPLPSTVSASRIAIAMLAGGGEAPDRGPLPRHRGDHAGAHALPSGAPGTLLPVRLGRRPGDRGHLPRARGRSARGRAGLQRRRHLRARLVGRARGERRGLD